MKKQAVFLIAFTAVVDMYAFGLIPQPQQMKRNGGEFESRSSSGQSDAPKSEKSKPRMTKLTDFF